MYKLKADFLESQIQDIIFTYDRKENQLEFSEYSCEMLGMKKIITDPFHNNVILSRLYSESIESIVNKMDLKNQNRQCIEIQFMNKPFCLIYQANTKAVICLLKEKTA